MVTQQLGIAALFLSIACSRSESKPPPSDKSNVNLKAALAPPPAPPPPTLPSGRCCCRKTTQSGDLIVHVDDRAQCLAREGHTCGEDTECMIEAAPAQK